MALEIPKVKNIFDITKNLGGARQVLIKRRRDLTRDLVEVTDAEKYNFDDGLEIWVFNREREEKKIESFIQSDEGGNTISLNNYLAQNFKIGTTGDNFDFDLSKVEVRMSKDALEAGIFIDIFKVDSATKKPIGTALATTQEITVDTGSDTDFTGIFDKQIQLDFNTEYSIVVRAADEGSAIPILWTGNDLTPYDNTTKGTTALNNWQSLDGGTTWSATGFTKLFSLFGV